MLGQHSGLVDKLIRGAMTISPWGVLPVAIIVVAVAGLLGPGWAVGAAVGLLVLGLGWLGWMVRRG
jgi:hypothetical protein